MSQEEYIKSGKIAGEALEFGKKLIKVNVSLLSVTEKIEDFIQKRGAGLAFPVQISLNSIAAHYTAYPDDKITFQAGDIVKLDIGTHVKGCVGDTATTVEVSTNKNTKLIEASRKALDNAIKICTIGTKLREIGRVIEKTIIDSGFKPIRNLTGHSVEEYSIHGGLVVPNYDNGDETELEEGVVIAIEPFATNGDGLIKETKPSSIYKLEKRKPVRDSFSRKILEYIEKEFKTLPFSKRDLIKKFGMVNIPLSILEKEGIIYQYPHLVEVANGLVSQAEHTMVIDHKLVVTTKIN